MTFDGMNHIHGKINNTYAHLREQYNRLKKRYEKEHPNIRKLISYTKNTLTTPFAIIGIGGMLKYQHPVIPVIGLITMVFELWLELYATKREFWKYNEIRYVISGRVPLGVPVFYFFGGATIATYVLFRTVGL